jgi:flagellar biosynthesis/type III secretory pathway chaperone
MDLMGLLRRECDLMARLVLVLQRERTGLTESDLAVIRDTAGQKGSLVPELGALQRRRRDLAAAALPGEPKPSLRRLVRAAPQEFSNDLRKQIHKIVDLGEQIFLLNRGNGQMLVQGRNIIRERLDQLRYRGGRETLYGRRAGVVSIGGASVIDRDL